MSIIYRYIKYAIYSGNLKQVHTPVKFFYVVNDNNYHYTMRRYIMPRGDRTGPDGLGPMTGRALGYCAGYDRPGFTQGYGGLGRAWGFGGGRGRGRGFGRGYGFAGYYGIGRRRLYRDYAYPPIDPIYDSGYTHDEALSRLREEEEAVNKELDALRKRIKELEAKAGSDESSNSNG
jgi:hypothetical protein